MRSVYQTYYDELAAMARPIEESLFPADPVPVGSRWRWKFANNRGGPELTAMSHSTDGQVCFKCNGNGMACSKLLLSRTDVLAYASRIADDQPAHPAKCTPGCTPAEPCRTEPVCPVFREEFVSARMVVTGYYRPYQDRYDVGPPEPMRSGLGGAGCRMTGTNGVRRR